jgi:molybdenum cofactor cytidylyltransferase
MEGRPVVGLLIAAGFGRRFDPTGRRAKLEERIDGEMVAVHTARALLAGCDLVMAAVRRESTALTDALAEAGCEIAPVSGPEGMGTSIACAARAALAAVGVRAVLVQPADMPWLEAATVREVAGAVVPNGEPIVLPVYRGQDGHPVRFDALLVPALARLAGERGARDLLQRHPAHRIAVSDVGVVRDLDTPADLDPKPRRGA